MNKPVIWIIGSGCCDPAAQKALKECKIVFSRGNIASTWLKEIGVKDINKLELSHDTEAQERSLQYLIQSAKDGADADGKFAYVTQITPLSVDTIAKWILSAFPQAEIHWQAGEDFGSVTELQNVLQNAGSITIMDGAVLAGKYHIPFDPSQTVLVHYPFSGVTMAELNKLIQDAYPQDHSLQLLVYKESGKTVWQNVGLKKLNDFAGTVEAVLIPARSVDSSLVSFEEVIAHLRAPEGCPWDKKQTHQSLRTYLLEETYEALDALDQGDMLGLREELGDIVLQIALHAQIAVEAGEFNMAEILEGINRKIVYRHPHVFGEVKVDGEKGVLQNWDKLKQQERAENGENQEKGILDGIPLSYPALAQAQVIQDRAARVGFDWNEIDPVIAKVVEEFNEVKNAPDEKERAKELGDLLFAVVNLVRWYHVDAESALRGTNVKFRRRFAHIEKRSRELKKPMQEMNLDEMDAYWNEAKKME